jgi:hypothetical protein
LGNLVGVLKNAKASSPISGSAVSWELGDSFNLRLFIHYIGDVH